MNDVIYDLAQRVAIAALTKEIGTLNKAETDRVHGNLAARLNRKASRYPIWEAIDIATTMSEAMDAATAAAITTKAGRKPGQTSEDEPWQSEQWPPPPITAKGSETIAEVATKRAAHYFAESERHFDSGDPLEATQNLSNAVLCSIAAIAARNHWPHAESDDIHDAVLALAMDSKPELAGDFHQMMAAISEQGHDLISAFVATMGQQDAIRMGNIYDSSDGSDNDARNFARNTVRLATQLAEESKTRT